MGPEDFHLQLAMPPTYQLADLLCNGYKDVVYVNSSNSVRVLLNNNGSGFQTDTTVATLSGYPTTGFHLADVNGDGIPDLVYDYKGQFIVLLGNGNGGFTAAPGFSATQVVGCSSLQHRFWLLDLNGDGLADILYEGTDSQIHVLLSTGSGFLPDAVWGKRTLPYGIGAQPYSLADVNGDGLPDFVYQGYIAATGG